MSSIYHWLASLDHVDRLDVDSVGDGAPHRYCRYREVGLTHPQALRAVKIWHRNTVEQRERRAGHATGAVLGEGMPSSTFQSQRRTA